MKTVAQILAAKGSDVWSVAPGASVYTALEVMAERGVGALLVMEGERLAGIVSERDHARKVALLGRRPEDTAVAEIMTPKVSYVAPERTVEECMALMTDQHIRHLPVLDDGRVIGVVSIGDVVKAVISEQEFMIRELERYITGG